MLTIASAARTGWPAPESFAAATDGSSYEVIDGEPFAAPTPSIIHQNTALAFLVRMSAYIEAVTMQLLFGPTVITFSPRRMVRPDLVVLPTVKGRWATSFREAGRLELAVEILSPHTARVDRYLKRRLYQSEGVREYWIVDSASRLVERWRPNDEVPEVLLDSLSWQPRMDIPPLTIDLEERFRWIHGE